MKQQQQRPTNAVIVERLEYLIKVVEAHIKDDQDNFAKIDEVFDGNGRPGMKTRVDRLEVADRDRTWHIRTLWVAILGGVISWLGGAWK